MPGRAPKNVLILDCRYSGAVDAVALCQSRPGATSRSVVADLGVNPETVRVGTGGEPAPGPPGGYLRRPRRSAAISGSNSTSCAARACPSVSASSTTAPWTTSTQSAPNAWRTRSSQKATKARSSTVASLPAARTASLPPLTCQSGPRNEPRSPTCAPPESSRPTAEHCSPNSSTMLTA